MVMEESRLRCQAIMRLPSLSALTEEPQKDISSITNIFQGNLLQQLPRALLADRVAKCANTFLCVVNSPGVLRVLLLQGKGDVEGPKVLLRGDSDIICVDDASLGYSLAVLEREVHSTVSDPEEIPVIAIWRDFGRDCGGEMLKWDVGYPTQSVVGWHWVAWVDVRQRCLCQGLDKCLRRQGEVV